MICMDDTVVALTRDELLHIVGDLSCTHPNVRITHEGKTTVISHNEASCEITCKTLSRSWERDGLEERFDVKVNLPSLGFPFSTVLDFTWNRVSYAQLKSLILFWLDINE